MIQARLSLMCFECTKGDRFADQCLLSEQADLKRNIRTQDIRTRTQIKRDNDHTLHNAN